METASILEYFLSTYNACQERALARTPVQPASASNDPDDELISYSIGPMDFPDSDIDLADVNYLTRTHHNLTEILCSPLPTVLDGRTAAVVLLRRHTLSIAESYLAKTAIFLTMDKRYHPDEQVQIDATGILDPDAYNTPRYLTTLAENLPLACMVLEDAGALSLFGDELRTLQLSARIFFDTFENVFGLKAIRKCRIAFEQLMQTIGTSAAIAALANYLRRQKTMFREIVALRKHGGGPSPLRPDNCVERSLLPQLNALNESFKALANPINDVTRTVANMDRRQKTFLTAARGIIEGLAKLLHPKAPAPTREDVAAILAPPNRYACLDRISEPHRSQIKAVIDYTVKHPIVFSGKTRDEFTLSNAARIVWNANEARWSKVPGAFDTFDQLKSACYNLQGKSDDPFAYQA